jgi:hypothetical protein
VAGIDRHEPGDHGATLGAEGAPFVLPLAG